MRVGKQSWKFENSVYLQETGTAVGPLEFQGPLQEYFDVKYKNADDKNQEMKMSVSFGNLDRKYEKNL